MANAFEGGTADLARAMTTSPRRDASPASLGSRDGDTDHFLTTTTTDDHHLSPSRSRHSSSSSEAALLRVRAKLKRQAEFLSVRGTLTHVIKYGDFDASTRTLVLVIPGNPGVPEYYDHFMETLHLASAR